MALSMKMKNAVGDVHYATALLLHDVHSNKVTTKRIAVARLNAIKALIEEITNAN